MKPSKFRMLLVSFLCAHFVHTFFSFVESKVIKLNLNLCLDTRAVKTAICAPTTRSEKEKVIASDQTNHAPAVRATTRPKKETVTASEKVHAPVNRSKNESRSSNMPPLTHVARKFCFSYFARVIFVFVKTKT